MKIVMVAFICLLFSGCASTEVTNRWRDPQYNGRFISAVVVCLTADSAVARECRDIFVRQLSRRGVRAVPGTGTMSTSSQDARAGARERGLEMVLVSRFMDKRSELEFYYREGSMLFMPHSDIWSEGVNTRENEFELFTTVLYDVASGKAVWSASSSTYVAGSQEKVLTSFVEAMLDEMERQGLIDGGHGR
ncbi:hypothetical protein [Geobacter sp. SVR]|uniref:hypothetical protein n=1 Tax=Geobacter sp. SVR TaxID=2495594 RepID=UPI00143EFC4D|nr:hypothetical protein [Geobacter sp. SVR]BCS52531.1 hypothetical protein GSVR_08390 [Geobacter sp. SVR]GCF84032.1 hypothetical protein GSbR_06320 [Geobacter sp. SVR]